MSAADEPPPADWSELEPLLDQALELEVARREAWLADLARARPDAARELRALLARLDAIHADSFLEQPLFSDAVPVAPALRSIIDQRTPPTGQTGAAGINSTSGLGDGASVGPYALLRQIGRGGTSSVWLAERSDGQLKRQVALKLPFIGSQLRTEHFLRERDMLSALTHPNIARLYDAGVSDTGQPYLAMEYVEGMALLRSCDERRSTIRERLQVFLQVLEAVQFAHAALIIHRDLKPSNVLLTPQGRVVLLDFGIGKLLTETAQPTRLGRALTLDYASPEQITGQPLGIASDIYSLGVTLYELLTGLRPHQPRRDSAAALEDAILADEVQRPSQREFATDIAPARRTSQRALRRALAGDLDNVVLKALQKNPAQRYASTSAFAQDIINHLNRVPVSARPDSYSYRVGRFIQRHKMQAAAAGVVVLALLGGSGLAVWQAQQAAAERDRALQLAARNAAINRFLSTLIMDSAASTVPVTVPEMLARSAELVQRDPSHAPEERAAILGSLADQYGSLEDRVRATQLLDQALKLTRDSGNRGLRSTLVCAHAVAAPGMAGAATAAVIDRELATLKSDPDSAAHCALHRSHVAREMGDSAAALRFAEMALEYHRAGSVGRTLDEGLLFGSIAGAYQLASRYADAERYYRLAMQKYAAQGRDGHANAVSVLSNWAVLSLNTGSPKNALERYDRLLQALSKRGRGDQPPPFVIMNRAAALEDLGRYPEALGEFQRGLDVAVQQEMGVEYQARALLGLASNALELRDIPSADRHLEQLSQLLDAAGIPVDAPQYRALLVAHARRALTTGRFPEARAEFERALTMQGNSMTQVRAHLGKAEVELQSGHTAAAEQSARSALALAKTAQGDLAFSCYTGQSWLMLGRALQVRGQSIPARAAFKSAVEHLSNSVDSNHPQLRRARELFGSAS